LTNKTTEVDAARVLRARGVARLFAFFAWLTNSLSSSRRQKRSANKKRADKRQIFRAIARIENP
jgi:hypothetical protein